MYCDVDRSCQLRNDKLRCVYCDEDRSYSFRDGKIWFLYCTVESHAHSGMMKLGVCIVM